jgi:hypothetical protein
MGTTLKIVDKCPSRFDPSISGGLPEDMVSGETEYMAIDDDSTALSSNFDPG